MDQLASVQMKKYRIESLESDLKPEAMLLKFKQDEANKNRERALEIAKIYANAVMHQVRYLAPGSGSNSYLQTPSQAPAPSHMFGNSSPLASYGYGVETQSYVHKQYRNTLYRQGLQ